MERVWDGRRRELGRQNLSQLLRMPYQAFIAEIHTCLAAAGYPEVRPAHGIVFQHLPAEGLRVTDLADRSQLTKQYIGALVDDLVALGYLERAPDPVDGRAKLVQMTARGWELTRVTERLIDDIESEWAGRLGGFQFRQLRRRLEDLIIALER